MPSSINPAPVWQDSTPVDKALVRAIVNLIKAEIDAGGFVNDPTTNSNATGTAALAAVHNAAVRHEEYRDATNQPDDNVTYDEPTHGFDVQFRFPVLTANRQVIFPASQGRAGAKAKVINRSSAFNLIVRREIAGDPGVYSDTLVPPGFIMEVRKDRDGEGNWTNLGKFADGATVADLNNLNASNLTLGTVPNPAISPGAVLQHLSSAVLASFGSVVAANSITASGGLVADQASPGADKLYGTDGGGNKGWFLKPTGGEGGVPSAHAGSHAAGGSDPVSITPAQVSGGTFATALISAASVTQHKAALTGLAQSQITGLETALASLQSQITALKTEEFTGEFLVSSTGAHIIDRRATYDYDVDRVTLFTPSGSGSLTVRMSIDDATITGMGAIIVPGGEVSSSSTGAKRMLADDTTLRLHIDGYDGTPKLLAFTIKKIRP